MTSEPHPVGQEESSGKTSHCSLTAPSSWGIREKLISVFLIIKILPLIAIALFAAQQIDLLGNTVQTTSADMAGDTRDLVGQVGDLAVRSSIEALDGKSRENIERLTTDTARRVAEFLYERDRDILHAAQLPILAEVYRHFLSAKVKDVVYHHPWELSKDGTGWQPAQSDRKPVMIEARFAENSKDFHYRPPEVQGVARKQPIYHELTFIDLEGQELIKISSTELLGAELRDVSMRENTWCKAETYFQELSRLKEGEIHVSRVIGPYLPSPVIGTFTPITAKKQSVPFKPEEAGYAGKENPVGKRFQGIIRWITPVYRSGLKFGYVTLALDHTHLMEFTDHLVPTEERYSAIADAGSGNYAFMWDFVGRNISHPRDYFIVGFDPATGEQAVPWLSAELYDLWLEQGKSFSNFERVAPVFEGQSLEKRPAQELTRHGMLGLDCRYLNFAPQCSGWGTLTQLGGSGSFVIYWSGLWKLTTAAAIPYYTGMYGSTPRGFGFVTIGANVEEFHSAATQSAEQIQSISATYEQRLDQKKEETLGLIGGVTAKTITRLTISTAIMIVLVVLIAVWIASTITGKIVHIIEGIQRFRAGEFGGRLDAGSQDELGQLSRAFNAMADTIQQAFAEIETARDRAQESDTAKSLFLANMSHEIRTPMNAIIGMSRLALASSESSRQRELLEGVSTSADSLLAIINDILDFSKIEAGQLDLDHHEFSLHRLISSTIKAVSVLADGKDVRVTAEIADRVPDGVQGDQARLRQILLNLLGNAVKFTNQGSVKLVVDCEGFEDDLLDITFAIEDTGIGIAREHLDVIFERFSQSDISVSRRHQGTGLGLAIARKLCNLMGGDITVTSEPGKGSVFAFHVLLELAEAGEEPVQTAVDGPERDGAERYDILLVEDNEANRVLTCMVLEAEGHRVTTAASGLEALNRLVAGFFDVVLMDVQMPVMDGFTATRIIRACEQGEPVNYPLPAAMEEQLRVTLEHRHQPVLALTAHAMRGDKQRCLASGMDEYLTKPFQPKQVISVLRRYGTRRRRGEIEGQAGVNGDGGPQGKFLLARKNLREIYGLNEEKVAALLATTSKVIDETFIKIDAAFAAGDLREVGEQALSLEGVLLNLRLSDEAAAAGQLRAFSIGGDEAAAQLEAERLRTGLGEFLPAH